MKTISIILLVLVLSLNGFSGDLKADNVKSYEQPVLLTSIGQAADVLIMKGLCKKAGVDVQLIKQATGDSLAGFKAVIIVAGGSSKGLGAAKIDISDEEARGAQLVEAAKKAGIPVLAFHIGGEARRGALSDGFNKLAANSAELIVVAADGDMDKMFAKAAKKSKARYIHIDKKFDAIDVLKDLFPKVEATEE